MLLDTHGVLVNLSRKHLYTVLPVKRMQQLQLRPDCTLCSSSRTSSHDIAVIMTVCQLCNNGKTMSACPDPFLHPDCYLGVMWW